MNEKERIKRTAAEVVRKCIKHGFKPTTKHKDYQDWFKEKFGQSYTEYTEELRDGERRQDNTSY